MPIALTAVTNETRKGLLIMWAYRFNLVLELFTMGTIFVFIGYFIGDGELDPESLDGTLVGYLVWYYAAIALYNMSGSLNEEATTGTLEQMYMSPVPTWIIFVGRVLATMLISTIMVVIVGTGLSLLMGIDIPLSVQALPVLGLTLLGLFGLGYALGGATLVFKRVPALTNMIQNLLLFLNGSLLPVDRLPDGIELVSKALPTTQGIIVLREVLLDGRSLAAVWSDGSLVYLLLHSALLLAIGWGAFKYAEGAARKRGTLGQY
jgi:ABC-2 type transport system permease protein